MMLNENLYNLLENVFGDVRIHSENEAATIKGLPVRPPSVITGNEHFVSGKQVTGGEKYSVCCPFCGDSNFHLWFNYLYNSEVTYNKWKLKFSRNLVVCFRRGCTMDDNNIRKLQDSLSGKRVQFDLSPGTLRKRKKKRQDPSTTYPPGHDLCDEQADRRVLDYLKNVRGLDPEYLQNTWYMYEAPVFYYNHESCLIIPVEFSGKLAFWQARYPSDKDIPQGREKYYTAKGSSPSKVLYNFDRASKSKTGVVVEGVFDAIYLPYNAVSIFKSSASPKQYEMLRECWDELILVPDRNDKEGQSIENFTELFKQLKKDKPDNYYYLLDIPEGCDPGDLKEDICSLIKDRTGRDLLR